MIVRTRKGIWAGRLDVSTALFLCNDLGIDVMAWLADWDTAIRDLSDPVIVVNCVWGILHVSLERQGITDTAFGKLIRKYTHADLAGMIVEELQRFVSVPDLLPGKSGRGGHSKPTAASLWASLWQAAAIACVPADQRTYGELIALADTRRKYETAQNALLACVTVNAQGGKAVPADFDHTGFLKSAKDIADRLENIHELSQVLNIPIKERRYGK